MRFFKPRFLCIAVILVASVAASWWTLFEPKPTVRFAGYHGDGDEKKLLFHMENPSGRPYCFTGYGPKSPFYTYCIWDGAKWEDCGPGWCGTGAGTHVLQPESEVRFQTYYFADPVRKGERCKLAMVLHPGTEWTARSQSEEGFIPRVLNWLGIRRSGALIVWSDELVMGEN